MASSMANPCKNFNLDDIIQDADTFELQSQKLAEEEKDKQPLQRITLQQVDKACLQLAHNCLARDARKFFETASRPAILEKTGFLFGCLCKRTKFSTSAREKSWAAFHKAYREQLQAVTAVTGSNQASMWLCMHLFEHLLDLNYPITQQDTGADEENGMMSDEVKDIVTYIGGSVVQKLKQRCLRLKSSSDKDAKLELFNHFAADEDKSSVLTSALNRWGLIFIQQPAKDFFPCWKGKFALFFRHTTQKTLAQFADSQEVLTCWQDMTSECEVQDEVKEQVFVQMVQMYFKIRVHHECRKYLDKLKYETCVPSKGLRKGLKAQ